MSDIVKPIAATGRRKTSVARVNLVPGTGKITVNERPVEQYFPTAQLRQFFLAPFIMTGKENQFDVTAKASGGGLTGQAGSMRLAISRALILIDATLRKTLKDNGCLTRDPREKERKKSGQPGARRRFQFSKR